MTSSRQDNDQDPDLWTPEVSTSGQSSTTPQDSFHEREKDTKETKDAVLDAACEGAVEEFPLTASFSQDPVDFFHGELRGAVTAAALAAIKDPIFEEWTCKYRSKGERWASFAAGFIPSIIVLLIFGPVAMAVLSLLCAGTGMNIALFIGHRLWSWRHGAQSEPILDRTSSLIYYFGLGVIVAGGIMALIPKYWHTEPLGELLFGSAVALVFAIIFMPVGYGPRPY